jgi:hypothetical protein
MGEDGDVEEGHRQNQWPHLSCRKDGEVSGCWAMSLQEMAAPTIPVFQLCHLGSSATLPSIGHDA